MAVSVEVEEGRNAGLISDQFDESTPAARNYQVDEFVGFQKRGDGIAVGRANGLDGVFGETGCLQPGAHAFDDHACGVAAFAAAAQDDCIARLEAERAGIGPDIGAAFVNHADHTYRHGDTFDGQAVGSFERRKLATDGVGQFGDFFQRTGHAVDPVVGQTQPVDETVGLFAFDTLHIFRIGFEQFALAGPKGLCRFAQSIVLCVCGGRQEAASGLASALAKFVNVNLRIKCLVGHSFSLVLYSEREALRVSATLPPGRKLPATYHGGGWKGHHRH